MTYSDVIDLKAAHREGGTSSSVRTERVMSRPMFARHMETMADEELNRQMTRTCGALQQTEIAALAARLGNLKTRYFALLLEVGQQRGLPQPEKFRELQSLRHYCEELETGYLALTKEVENGAVPVQGVTDPVY